MSTNYLQTVEFPDVRLSRPFKEACKKIVECENSINKKELEECYYLYNISKCKDDIKAMGYDKLDDFAQSCFGFQSSTVRNFKAIGAICDIKEITTDGKKRKEILSIYADENGNDFTRSQLNEIMSITVRDYKAKAFKDCTEQERACYNFRTLLEQGAISYSDSQMRLRRTKKYLQILAKYPQRINSTEEISTFVKLVDSKIKLDNLVFDTKNKVLRLPELPNNEPENASTTSNEPENASTTSSEPENASTTSNEPENVSTTSNEPENASTTSNEPQNNEPENASTTSKEEITKQYFLSRMYDMLEDFQTAHTASELEELLAEAIDCLSNY